MVSDAMSAVRVAPWHVKEMRCCAAGRKRPSRGVCGASVSMSRKRHHDERLKPSAWITSWATVPISLGTSLGSVGILDGQMFVRPTVGLSNSSRWQAKAYASVLPAQLPVAAAVTNST